MCCANAAQWIWQVALQLPSGATFISSTPEQLYVRRGSAVASEAVAGTRPRGPAGEHLCLFAPRGTRAQYFGGSRVCACD